MAVGDAFLTEDSRESLSLYVVHASLRHARRHLIQRYAGGRTAAVRSLSSVTVTARGHGGAGAYLTGTNPPGEMTHWTVPAMAKVVGINASSLRRIRNTDGLAPHRIHRFKLSNDPEFASKLPDVVGLYIDPPAHAIVLSVDENSQIQALDRTQPGLTMKKGHCGAMTHEYNRNGTTTLLAALDVLEGTVVGH